MKTISNLLVLAILTTSVMANAQKQNPVYKPLEIEIFPKAGNGYKQVYIHLPVKKNEDRLKIEVFIGKEEMLDCNNHFMAGAIETHDLEGWGYNYFKVISDGTIAGTLMRCPDDTLTKKFVHLDPQILNYNSNLPLVYYVPKGFEVRYRILKAEKTWLKATDSH